MVDNIQKSLDKLSSKERCAVDELLAKIKNKQFDGLDLKKLKGWNDVYRIRKGGSRIIYRLNFDGNAVILEIGRRNDNTYNF